VCAQIAGEFPVPVQLGDDRVAWRLRPLQSQVEQVRDVMNGIVLHDADPVMVEAADLHSLFPVRGFSEVASAPVFAPQAEFFVYGTV
jgi:hypothetical protein